MNMPVEKAYMARSLADEYTRHNQEIRKIRKVIRQKGASARFERFLGNCLVVSGKRGKSTGNACKVGLKN